MNIDKALEVKQQSEYESPNDSFILERVDENDYRVKKITHDNTDRAILSIARNEAVIMRNCLLDQVSVLERIINNTLSNGGN